MHETLGMVAAVLAGGSYAAGGVLQQHAAAAERRSNPARLVAALLRRPEWLVGIAFAVVSNVLEAFALWWSPLAAVQPLLVSELLLAVPVSTRLAGVRLRRADWLALVGVAAGVAVALWGAAPSGPSATGSTVRWLAIGGAVALAAAALAGLARLGVAAGRATCLAAAAALTFALASALMAATVHGFGTAGLGGFARPAPYAMAVASCAGLLLLQSAYQAGPLAITMPMVDWVQPIVGVLLGVGVLGEAVETGPLRLAVASAGALVALAGIVRLAASPQVRHMRPPSRPADPGLAAPDPADPDPARRGPADSGPADPDPADPVVPAAAAQSSRASSP